MPAMTICQETRLRELRQRALQAAAAWDESKHPRDQAGRFGTGGGGGTVGNKGRRRSLLHPYHSEWSGDDGAGGSRSTAGRRARNRRMSGRSPQAPYERRKY